MSPDLRSAEGFVIIILRFLRAAQTGTDRRPSSLQLLPPRLSGLIQQSSVSKGFQKDTEFMSSAT